MHQQRPTQRRGKAAIVILAACALLMSMTVLGAPDASAHGGKFDHDDARFAEGGCDDDTVPNGRTGVLFGREIIGCTPAGDYVPVGDDQELCDEAAGIMTEGYCTFDRARPCGDRPDFITPISNGMCLRVALVLAEFAHTDHVQARSVSPVCVESDFVQNNAFSESVGAQFGVDGRDYLIVSGNSSCTFNCVDGWDINCDGKLGDFCASEYDLTKVAGVGGCLEAMDIAPTVD